MKILIILSIVAALLSQVKATAEDPVALFKLYNSDASNDKDGSTPITGLDSYTFDQDVRYEGDTFNKAIDLSTDTTQIKIPKVFGSITGDYFFGVWAKLIIPAVPDTRTIFAINYNYIHKYMRLDFDFTTNSVKSVLNGTYGDSGPITNYNNTWVHYGLERSGNNFQIYVNGVAKGTPKTDYISMRTESTASLGSTHDENQLIDGSIAEFAAYNTAFYSEYYTNNLTLPEPPVTSLNSKVPIAQDCPTNTSEWNIGSDSANRVCIHDTCAERMGDLISFVKNDLTITTNTTGKNWADQLDFDYTISKMDCGDSNNEECFIDLCFQHGIIQAQDTDYNLTIPNPMDMVYPSETGFTHTDYHNDTNCDHSANSSSCYYVFPFFFSGIIDNTAFTRDQALIDYEFTIVYSKVPGEDTIIATLQDQQFGAVQQTASDVEANIENGAEALAGATLTFKGTPPTDIFVGDELELVLQAPAGNLQRDFKNGTFEVELVFTSNGTDVIIPITPSASTYVNDGNSTAGADRSIEFTIDANYLGTYTIRASATLESSAGRRLLQVVSEENSLNSNLQITVNKPQITQSYYLVLIVSISLVLIVAQNIYLKSMQQKNTKLQYEQANQQDTKV